MPYIFLAQRQNLAVPLIYSNDFISKIHMQTLNTIPSVRYVDNEIKQNMH